MNFGISIEPLKKKKWSQTFSTLDESRFLDDIGTFVADKSRGKARHLLLLKNYIIAAENRVNWGDISKFEVIEHATELLKKLEAK